MCTLILQNNLKGSHTYITNIIYALKMLSVKDIAWSLFADSPVNQEVS